MTKKSAAGMGSPNEPKGDCCEFGSAAWASKASNGNLLRKTGPDLVAPGREAVQSVGARGEAGEHAVGKGFRLTPLDGLAQRPHQLEKEGQVVDGVEPEAEQFPRREEMAKIGA